MSNERIKILVFFIIATGLPLLPQLSGLFTFANGDVLNLHLPNLQFYAESLKSGQNFFWNPYILGGFPGFASTAGGLLSPLNLGLFSLLPLLAALPWAIFLNLVLAGFFMAMFLRRLGLSFWAQIFGGLIFIFSQWFIAIDLGIVNSFPVLPLLFLLVWEARSKKLPIILGGLVLGYMWFAAHYNWIFMILVAGFVFACYLGPKMLGKYALMNLIGAILGMAQIYPTFLYSQLSARTAVSFAEAQGGGLTIFDLPKLFLPYLRFSFLSNAEALIYLGLVPLCFLIFGFLVKTGLARFFKTLFVLSVLVSVKYSPLFWVLNKLPAFESFRGPSRWMFIGFFAGSVLAAYGLEELSCLEIKTWLWKILGFVNVAVLAAALLVSAALAVFPESLLPRLLAYFDANFYAQTSGLPLEHYHQVIENMLSEVRSAFALSNLKFLFSILFLFFGILVIKTLANRKELKLKNLVLFSAANFLLVLSFYHGNLPVAALARQSQTAQILSSRPGTVLAFLPGTSEWQKLSVPYGYDPQETFVFQSELLTPNLNVLYEIPSLDGYENLMPRRVARILALLGSDRATVGDKLSELPIPPEEKLKMFLHRKPLLDKLGIRYLVSAIPFPNSAGRLKKVSEHTATSQSIPIYVYENPDARPLVYGANKIVTTGLSELEAFRTLQELPADTDLLECEPCPNLTDSTVKDLRVLSQNHDSIQFVAEIEGQTLLVFQQTHLPGWQALLDGQSVTIYTVNSVFMGIVVTSGTHEVKFNYHYGNLFKFR